MQFLSPPRLRRYGKGMASLARGVGAGYRKVQQRRSLQSAVRAARVLRAIGATPLLHTFSRPAGVIRISDNGTNIIINGQVATNSGLQQGMYATSRAGSDIVQTIKFGLSQMFQFSFLQTPGDLSGLYDNYRIKGVILRFDYSANTAVAHSTATSTAHSSLPLMHYCIDPDDINPPTSETRVLQYSKSNTVRLGDKPLFIKLVPRAQGVAASTVTAGGTGDSSGMGSTPAVSNMLSTNTWFDAVNGQTIPHFGMKYWIENIPIGLTGNAQVNWVLTISPTYILECKNIH